MSWPASSIGVNRRFVGPCSTSPDDRVYGGGAVLSVATALLMLILGIMLSTALSSRLDTSWVYGYSHP